MKTTRLVKHKVKTHSQSDTKCLCRAFEVLAFACLSLATGGGFDHI